MRRRIGLLCAGLLLVLAGFSATSQATEVGFRVPFDFMVGRHMFPAGEYRVTRASATAVRIEAVRGIASVTVASDGATKGVLRPFHLVFDNQGRPPRLVGVYGAREVSRELHAMKSKSLTVITTKAVFALAENNARVQQR